MKYFINLNSYEKHFIVKITLKYGIIIKLKKNIFCLNSLKFVFYDENNNNYYNKKKLDNILKNLFS